MAFPSFRIGYIDEEEGLFRERCGTVGTYLTPDAMPTTNVYTEASVSGGDPEEVGLYADIAYLTPRDAAQDAYGMRALQVERYARLWYFAPEEAHRIQYVVDADGTCIMFRLGGRLCDLRPVERLAYLQDLDWGLGGLFRTLAAAHRKLAALKACGMARLVAWGPCDLAALIGCERSAIDDILYLSLMEDQDAQAAGQLGCTAAAGERADDAAAGAVLDEPGFADPFEGEDLA